MRINKRNLLEFNMKVNSFTYQPFTVSYGIFQPERSIRPIIGKRTLTPKPMELIAEFRSKKDISDFIAELLNHEENVIDIEDGYYYRCYLSTLNQPVEEYWQGWYRVKIPLLVIQEGIRRKIALNKKENYIYIAGNWQTECVYEITPKADMDDITVDGHIIRHLYTGKTVYLDGEKKRVYSSTEPNKYVDCTLKQHSFPTLKPGKQLIALSNDKADVMLRYTPIFV